MQRDCSFALLLNVLSILKCEKIVMTSKMFSLRFFLFHSFISTSTTASFFFDGFYFFIIKERQTASTVFIQQSSTSPRSSDDTDIDYEWKEPMKSLRQIYAHLISETHILFHFTIIVIIVIVVLIVATSYPLLSRAFSRSMSSFEFLNSRERKNHV